MKWHDIKEKPEKYKDVLVEFLTYTDKIRHAVLRYDEWWYSEHINGYDCEFDFNPDNIIRWIYIKDLI